MLPKSRFLTWRFVTGSIVAGLVALFVGNILYTAWLDRNYPLIMCAAMPNDATQIHMGLANGKIVVFDLDANRLRQIRLSNGEYRGPVMSIACLGDGAVCFEQARTARILEPTGTLRCRLQERGVERLAPARGGSCVAILPRDSQGGGLTMFHADSCDVAWDKWTRKSDAPSASKWPLIVADVSSSGNVAALVFGEDRAPWRKVVEMRDSSDGTLHRTIPLSEGTQVYGVAVSPRGTGLAIARFEGSVELRADWRSDEVSVLRCPRVWRLCWIGESGVVGGAHENRIVFGDLATGRTTEITMSERAFWHTIQATADGKSVVAATSYFLYVWSPPSFDTEHSQPVLRAVLSTDHLWGDWDTKDLPPEVTKPRRPDGRPL